MCKDQTRLTFQRSYRGNLRCDIKDRRIVSALLTPPRGNSCCFLTRQLYIARKPWIIASSSSSNLWSCSLCLPSDHTVKHLGHDYRFCVGMETDGENELGFSWGGLTQEIYIALKTHCLTNRRWQLYLLAFEAFFALPTSPVFHVPCTVCRRVGFRTLHRCQSTALLQSPTGVWFRRCGVARSLFPQSRTARTKVATSRAILLHQAKKVVHDSCSLCLAQQKEKNVLHHRRLTRLQSTRHFHRARHVSIQLHNLQFLRLIRSLLLEVQVTPLFSLHLSIMRSYW